MIELPVRRLRDEATLPTQAYVGDAGLDLAACERHEVGPGERAVIPTGLAVEIPDGHGSASSFLPAIANLGGYLWRVRLTAFIEHTRSSDLDVTLTSPSGTVVTVTSDNGGSSDNVFNGTAWDDKFDPGNQVPFPGPSFAASSIVTDTAYTNNVLKATLVPEEALAAFHALCRSEGIIPALESAHAVAQAMKMAPKMKKSAILLVNLSGRGDKDMHTVAERSGKKL